MWYFSILQMTLACMKAASVYVSLSFFFFYFWDRRGRGKVPPSPQSDQMRANAARDSTLVLFWFEVYTDNKPIRTKRWRYVL